MDTTYRISVGGGYFVSWFKDISTVQKNTFEVRLTEDFTLTHVQFPLTKERALAIAKELPFPTTVEPSK